MNIGINQGFLFRIVAYSMRSHSYTIKGDQVRTHKHVLCRQRMKTNMQHQRISTKNNMILTMSYVMWSRQTHGNRIESIRAYRLANEHTHLFLFG